MNDMKMSVVLRRIDVCDLLLACMAARDAANDSGEKWNRLYDSIRDQLKDFDEHFDN